MLRCPSSSAGARYPDLLIAFEADMETHQRNNGYIIAEQGKPPDFVLGIASPRTSSEDSWKNQLDYAGFDILEYWCLDETSTGR